MSAENVAATDPPAVKLGVKDTGAGPVPTLRDPTPPAALAGVGASCPRIDAGTVNPPVPAVVLQINSVTAVIALLPVPVVLPE